MPEPTDDEIEDLFEIHNGPIAEAERNRRALYFDDTRSWVDPNGYRLSDRLWLDRRDMRRQLDQMVRGAISRGDDGINVAKDIERFLNPRYAPIRNAKGRIIRDKRKGVYTGKPRDGMGSFPARRLMRTEITRAHGQAAIESAKKLKTFVRWRLSGSHPKPDQCDENAQGSSRHMPAGVYTPQEVPAYPNHPQDLCHIQHWIPDSQIDDLVARLRVDFGLAPADEAAAYRVANRLVSTAQRAEGAVTDALQAIGQQIDGELQGLQYRVKTVSSTQRKLMGDMKSNGLTAEAAGADLKDILRYTYVLPDASYGAGVRTATEELIGRNFTPNRLKNFWANDSGYTAAQAVFKSPSGQMFELQFHTAESLRVKEKISHPLYEKVRTLDSVADAEEIDQLEQQIAEAWRTVRADPPNLEGLDEAVQIVQSYG